MSEIMRIKGGKEGQYDITIYEEEKEEDYKGVKYKQKNLRMKIKGLLFWVHLTKVRDIYALEIYLDEKEAKMLGTRKGTNYITITKEDYEKIQNIQKEIEKYNKEEYEKTLRSIPLRFKKQEKCFTLLDYDYEVTVFVPNRELLHEERERYNKILNVVKEVDNKNYHDGFLDATKYKKEEATIDELEQFFVKQIQKYEELIKKEQEERKKREEEYKKKVQEALEEAKRTGEEVIIRKVGVFDGDACDVETEFLKSSYGLSGQQELGAVVVYEVATPDGRIIEKASPCY